MKSYDLVYAVRPDLEPDMLKALVERVTQRIIDQGGAVEAVDQWGKRRMSFTTKRNREGLFVHIRFSVDPAKVAEIRRAVNLMEELLRVILTNAIGKLPEPKPAEAAPVAPPPEAPAQPQGPAGV